MFAVVAPGSRHGNCGKNVLLEGTPDTAITPCAVRMEDHARAIRCERARGRTQRTARRGALRFTSPARFDQRVSSHAATDSDCDCCLDWIHEGAVVWAQTRPVADVEARLGRLLERMAIEEKLGQLEQLGGNPDGQPLASQLDLVRKGRIGSLFNVRGAKHQCGSAYRCRQVAIQDSGPVRFRCPPRLPDALPDSPGPGE